MHYKLNKKKKIESTYCDINNNLNYFNGNIKNIS